MGVLDELMALGMEGCVNLVSHSGHLGMEKPRGFGNNSHIGNSSEYILKKNEDCAPPILSTWRGGSC